MKTSKLKTQSSMKNKNLVALLSLMVLVSTLSVAARSDDDRLGSPQQAGPFQVTLLTDPATPQAGVNRFRADVTQGGKPVKDAQVKLRLTMPLHRQWRPVRS
jgi:hypothetical protein